MNLGRKQDYISRRKDTRNTSERVPATKEEKSWTREYGSVTRKNARWKQPERKRE
jgi:hypothetical protein